MKYAELQQRVAATAKSGESFVRYAIAWVPTGRPSPTLVALIPQKDGTVTATVGDLREKVEPVTNEDGSIRVFANEDEACDWAWENLAPSLTYSPHYTTEQTEKALRSGRAQMERVQAILDRSRAADRD